MLRGKNTIITGARSGIGLATLNLFASQGANVWAIVRHEDEKWLQTSADTASRHGVSIKPVIADIASPQAVKDAIKTILADKLPIDILVNAAGVTGTDRSFPMSSFSNIREVFDINFFGTLELTQLVIRNMLRSKSGSIVNVTSIAAFGEDTSQMEYAASKAALECATKKLARELAPMGIRINSVAPGWTDTPMTENFQAKALEKIRTGLPMGRFALPEEIAQGILFLASDKASFITGSCLRIDGGGFSLKNFISK